MMYCSMPCPQCGKLIPVAVSAVFPDAWQVRPQGPTEVPLGELCGCWHQLPRPQVVGLEHPGRPTC